MKKFTALLLALAMVFALAACGSKTETSPAASADASASAASNVKIGIVLVGDENVGYDTAHIEGIKAAAKACGIADAQIIWKYNIEENEKCADAIDDLVSQGCKYVFSDSYGHQSYMQDAAGKNPDVTFVSMTGDTAATSGLKNFKNAFNDTYQSRYVSGVVAGMKLKELVDAGKITDTNKDAKGNIKLGYVGAFNYAEVVSGYTAFYLGVKSIVDNVVMDVQYTNSWYRLASLAQGGRRGAFWVARGYNPRPWLIRIRPLRLSSLSRRLCGLAGGHSGPACCVGCSWCSSWQSWESASTRGPR